MFAYQLCLPCLYLKMSYYNFFQKTFFYLKPVIFRFVQKPSYTVGLYSNIPQEYGLVATEWWLDKFLESLHPRVSKEFFLESIKFILENKNLNFNNKYFNQIKGIAMGTIFGPTYANLTMGFFELTFYDLCRDKFGEDLENFIFESWSRFLDDCETLLEENKINTNDLLCALNSINPSIQFTMSYCKDAIPFLDILIKRNNDKIWMDIYCKPTDTQKCLPFLLITLNIAKCIYLSYWHVVYAQLLKTLKQK